MNFPLYKCGDGNVNKLGERTSSLELLRSSRDAADSPSSLFFNLYNRRIL